MTVPWPSSRMSRTVLSRSVPTLGSRQVFKEPVLRRDAKFWGFVGTSNDPKFMGCDSWFFGTSKDLMDPDFLGMLMNNYVF